MLQETFTLTDADGQEHQYLVTAHTASQGMPVIDRMIGMGIGPLVEAFFASGAAGDTDLGGLLAGIDKKNVAEGFMRGFNSAGGLTALAPIVLQHTMRDGERLAGKGAFDAAYQRNYRELRDAVWAVIKFNGFFDAAAGLLDG